MLKSEKVSKYTTEKLNYLDANLCKRICFYSRVCTPRLKVPKRENFSLAFFAQTKPIWVCDFENKIK
jgi:hypothetical protein